MVKNKVQTWLSHILLAFHTDFAGALIIQQDVNEGSALHWDLLPGVTSSVGQGDTAPLLCPQIPPPMAPPEQEGATV